MANVFQVGDLVRATGTFTDLNNVVTDPESVYFSFRAPNGTITTYQYGVNAQVIKSSTGIYYVEINITSSGTWYYRFFSTGVGQTAGEDLFMVEPSKFA